LLQIGGVEPQIWPFAFQRPVEKRADALKVFWRVWKPATWKSRSCPWPAPVLRRAG
jgi:hypothetical protein